MAGVPSSRDYVGGFGTELMIKDLGLAKEVAKSVGMEMELGQKALAVYERAKRRGWGGRIFLSFISYS